jgi:hypothetical protein
MEEEKETEIEEKNLANFLSLSYGIIEAFKFVGVLHLGYCRGDKKSRPDNILNPILCKLEYLN